MKYATVVIEPIGRGYTMAVRRTEMQNTRLDRMGELHTAGICISKLPSAARTLSVPSVASDGYGG